MYKPVRIVATVSLMLFLAGNSFCLPEDSTSLSRGVIESGAGGRELIASALVGGILAGSLVDSYFAWWHNATKPFTFHAEGWLGGDHLGIDKAGHLFTSYFYFHTFHNIMLWGGHRPSTALWWAAGTSAFFALSVEIGDGVSEFGFDYQDLVFNLAGIGYGVLQAEHPFLRNFSLKWSYVPDNGYRFPPRFTNHYDGHTYWLTVNPQVFLPGSVADVWPDVLRVAVGYSVADRVSRREFVVGLDFNLEVCPAPGSDLQLLQKTINMIHLPAPAVKFSPSRKPEYHLLHTN